MRLAPGFVAAGTACGIKASGDPDLALVATGDRRTVTAAATFTDNRAAAAPVLVSRAHLDMSGGRAAAVVLNSGNANAATGDAGIATATEACALVASGLGCAPEEVLVCSIGLIGIPLGPERFRTGVPALIGALSEDGCGDAAGAIMTTDTRPKHATVTVDGCTFAGIAKGAAMLAPNMATMLAVVTTDAAIDDARSVLQAAVCESFNRLTVDGCTSTNDTVILLASGTAGSTSKAGAALAEVCLDLARQIADDAEGATKVVTVRVTGARTPAEADRAARKVAESQLVKCSWYGEDPYWGRILSDLGTAGVDLDPERVSIAYGGTIVSQGMVGVDHDLGAVAGHLATRNLDVHCDLGVGPGSSWVLTNDLTHAYIDENKGTS